jgi:hypothetical protein
MQPCLQGPLLCTQSGHARAQRLDLLALRGQPRLLRAESAEVCCCRRLRPRERDHKLLHLQAGLARAVVHVAERGHRRVLRRVAPRLLLLALPFEQTEPAEPICHLLALQGSKAELDGSIAALDLAACTLIAWCLHYLC